MRTLLRIYKGQSNEKNLKDGPDASSNAFVQAKWLTPIWAAAKYDFYRCYLQIMKWQDVSNASPALENLLKMV